MKHKHFRAGAAAAVFTLSLLILTQVCQAANLLPWVKYKGSYTVTAGVGTGALILNATVSEMDYENGEIWVANVAGVESIFGAKVLLAGATRTGNYSFNGDPAVPDDVRLSIVGSDGFVYFDANLADSEFVPQGTLFVWLNQFLDANNPDTLNLYNIVLNTDPAHPSRYIDELARYLGANNVSGLKMQLRAPLGTGSFTTSGTGPILLGLIDGLQSQGTRNTPPTADAGSDLTVPTSQVGATTIQGVVTDGDAAATLSCSWTDGNGTVLVQGPVAADGACPLDLGTTTLGLGVHTLTLWASDGIDTTSDAMALTIINSLPNADAGPDVAISSEEVAATVLHGKATDFDGTALTCTWSEGTTELLAAPADADACPLPLAGLGLARGIHTLTLTVTDGLDSSSDEMELNIINTAPIANAGENVTVTSDQIGATAITGTATDFDGDAVTCRWTEDETVLLDWIAAGPGGECVLDLNALSFGLGEHALTFTANDGMAVSANIMKLTVNNSAPRAGAGGEGVYQIGTPVVFFGDVADFDGDPLHYAWLEGSTELCAGDVQAIAGGTAVLLPDCVVTNLDLGMHTVALQVEDGINAPVSRTVSVQIVDTTAPELKPVANKYLLWPPNHKMVDIVIAANATDNGGCPLTLAATVSSNEPVSGLNSGDQGPDWTVPVIDQNTGMISLQLRAERSGRGNGRKYILTITATDCAGNASVAKVKIRVPKDQDHDDRKREDKEERERDDRKDRKDCHDKDDD
ncbi:MAG: hypothetical protein AB1568_16850 [Thermodesulfobacteriota bacterium]